MAYKKLRALKTSCSPRGAFLPNEFMYIDETTGASEITMLISGGFVVDTGVTVDASQLAPSGLQGSGFIPIGEELP